MASKLTAPQLALLERMTKTFVHVPAYPWHGAFTSGDMENVHDSTLHALVARGLAEFTAPDELNRKRKAVITEKGRAALANKESAPTKDGAREEL